MGGESLRTVAEPYPAFHTLVHELWQSVISGSAFIYNSSKCGVIVAIIHSDFYSAFRCPNRWDRQHGKANMLQLSLRLNRGNIMSNSLEFSAVIFDLDGTLLYTLEEIAVATNAALARLGYPEHPVSAYPYFVGNGAKTLALRVLPEEKQCQEEHEALYAVLIEEYGRLLNTIARPYDGVMEMLSAYITAGKQLAVLSNKPDELTKVAVKKFLPGVDFITVQGALSDVPLKPVPDSALGIASMMKLEPEQIVFVGDSDVDMQTAHNAGMIPVGASWGFRGAEELTAAGARIVLDAPIDLNSLL